MNALRTDPAEDSNRPCSCPGSDPQSDVSCKELAYKAAIDAESAMHEARGKHVLETWFRDFATTTMEYDRLALRPNDEGEVQDALLEEYTEIMITLERVRRDWVERWKSHTSARIARIDVIGETTYHYEIRWGNKNGRKGLTIWSKSSANGQPQPGIYAYDSGFRVTGAQIPFGISWTEGGNGGGPGGGGDNPSAPSSEKRSTAASSIASGSQGGETALTEYSAGGSEGGCG